MGKKKSLFISDTNLLPCLNKAEHFAVEYNGEKAAQRVGGWIDILHRSSQMSDIKEKLGPDYTSQRCPMH